MKFNPPIESRSTEELVLIAYATEEEWQREAIEAARQELNNRGLSSLDQQELLAEIKERIREEELIELENRKIEDYSLNKMVSIVLTWPIYMFRDWGLKKEGYHLKYRRRLQLISLGFLLTILSFYFVSKNAEDERKKRLEEIESIDISDWEENRIEK